MKILKLKVLILFFLFFQAVSSQNTITAIKFMGSISTHQSIDEKNFWGWYDEHVKLIIRNNDFTEDVKKLINEPSNFNLIDIKYAFLVKNKKGKIIETFYTDNLMEIWALKSNNKFTLYYDKERKIYESLIQHYSFFNDCW
jgi:hypothetical protein